MGQVWKWITDGTAWFMAALKGAAGMIAGKVLAFFGLTMISFQSLLPELKDFVLQFASGLPPEAMDFLGAIGIGQAMSMVFSALTVRLGMKIFIVPTAVAAQLRGGGA